MQMIPNIWLSKQKQQDLFDLKEPYLGPNVFSDKLYWIPTTSEKPHFDPDLGLLFWRFQL